MGKLTYHPLIHTLLDFNLAQNSVDGQVSAVEKVTPIDTAHRSRQGTSDLE